MFIWCHPGQAPFYSAHTKRLRCCPALPARCLKCVVHCPHPPAVPVPCSAAMAVLRQQLTFVHELYESGGWMRQVTARSCVPAVHWLAGYMHKCRAVCNRCCLSINRTACIQSAGMVDEGEKEDMLAPLDKRLRHLEITGARWAC